MSLTISRLKWLNENERLEFVKKAKFNVDKRNSFNRCTQYLNIEAAVRKAFEVIVVFPPREVCFEGMETDGLLVLVVSGKLTDFFERFTSII